jgi:hypothetical protein
MCRFACLLGLLVLPAFRAHAGVGEERLWLVRDGRPLCTIVHGRDDAFAADRLRRWMADKSGATVGVVAAERWQPSGQECVVLVGSPASNAVLAKLAAEIALDVDPAALGEEGYRSKRVRHQGRDWVVLSGGSRDGARHAVVDLLNWELGAADGGIWLGPLDTRQVPRLRYRWFWNWDHRMDWGGPGKVGTLMGGGGKFSKEPAAFLIDFKRCIDFMADHKFNGLIIWGFLRDTHGGVPASQELCRYARERGVRILPGVGTSGYAGYYYEGRHPLNVDTWLAQHPELRARDANGRPHAALCPSKKANQDWLDDGAKWLFSTFAIGGVNLEMGDFFVCHCDDCRRARAAIPSQEPDYYKDMAVSHMITLKTMRRLAPDAWLSYATYTGYTADMAQTPPRFVAMIPEDALCQWTLTGMAGRWPGIRPMARHNLGYLHWCNSSTHTEDDFYLGQVRDICRNAAQAGFEGLDTYGELSDARPNAELFYLAWEAFSWDPEMRLDQFVQRRLARLYGGPQAARALVEIIPLVSTRAQRDEPENCRAARKLAEAARGAATAEGRVRWERLVAYLHRHELAAEDRRQQLRRQEAAARAGRKLQIVSVTASDEDPKRGWPARNAIDGNVAEPAGYWLTQRSQPAQAWLELALARPEKIDRIVLFHQLNPAHYRSQDYTIRARVAGNWVEVVKVKGNQLAGWVAHPIAEVTADAVRLEITRSAYGARMGVGEIELRCCGSDGRP